MAYKILWYSIPALHDNTNGAAIHNKILLEALAARGFTVKALNATVADDPRGLAIFDKIVAQIKPDPQKSFLQFYDKGVEYIVVKTKHQRSDEVNTADQGLIFNIFSQFLEKYQPDLIMGYSGDFFSCYARHEAHVRGIPLVYAICNGLHRSFAFPDCDLVFSPSEATAKFYRENDGIDVKAVGQFIDRAKVTAADRSGAKYITLINPVPEKGLAILVKLAQIWQQRHPEQKFMVVKSVGDYDQLVCRLHYADGNPFISEEVRKQNPQVVRQVLHNIDVAEHTDDVRLVYALTKVLLVPSVWHEAWGCVATEANFNNIPVLASQSGGLAEAVHGGGINLPAPASTQRDYYCIPSDEEIMPWVEALERLLNEDWSKQCAEASAYNDLDRSVDRLLEYMLPLMEKGSKEKRPLEKSHFFSAKTMEQHKATFEAAEAAAAAQAAAATQEEASKQAAPAAPGTEQQVANQAAPTALAAATAAASSTASALAAAPQKPTQPQDKAQAKPAASQPKNQSNKSRKNKKKR